MPLDRDPAPIDRRRREPASVDENDDFLIGKNLFSSLAAGPAVMAALSAASYLQHTLPDLQIGGFPLAGLIGLVLGLLAALPLARWSARGLDPARPGQVLLVAVISGLVLATPAAFYAPAIGWMGGPMRMYIIAGVLSASGLIWGGYLNFDGPDDA